MTVELKVNHFLHARVKKAFVKGRIIQNLEFYKEALGLYVRVSYSYNYIFEQGTIIGVSEYTIGRKIIKRSGVYTRSIVERILPKIGGINFSKISYVKTVLGYIKRKTRSVDRRTKFSATIVRRENL